MTRGGKLRTWVSQPLFVKLWAGPIWIILGLSRFAVLRMHFWRIADALGDNQGASPWVPLASRYEQDRARQIGRAIRAVSNNTPWDSNCFVQALTARLLLGLYGIPYAVFFGVARQVEGEGLNAHAWVACDRVAVTGGDGFHGFTVVSMFVPARLAEGRSA